MGPEARWDQHAELLATIADLQQWTLHVLLKAHFKGQFDAPKPFPRPGAKPETPTPRISTKDLRGLLNLGGDPSHPPASAS